MWNCTLMWAWHRLEPGRSKLRHPGTLCAQGTSKPALLHELPVRQAPCDTRSPHPPVRAIIWFSIKALKRQGCKEVFICIGVLKSSTDHLCWPVHLPVQRPRLLSHDRDVTGSQRRACLWVMATTRHSSTSCTPAAWDCLSRCLGEDGTWDPAAHSLVSPGSGPVWQSTCSGVSHCFRQHESSRELGKVLKNTALLPHFAPKD